MTKAEKQFKKERKENIALQGGDKEVWKVARRFLAATFPYKHSYNFDWLGRPIIQYPQDIVAMQELVWKIKPDLVIETGIAHGGSLVFYASILELLGKGKVLGIDIEIRPHNRLALEHHPLFKRIKLIEGSSTDEKVFRSVEQIAKKYKTVLVVLDSLHTHDHVLQELNKYSKFVSRGSYLVVFDTFVEYFPKTVVLQRPWGKGSNPATAVSEFLKKNKNFVRDQEIENKLLLTTAPGGYLKRVK
jgi:cephalosporin hydroxylase